MTVSVVIPSYNGGRFIGQAILSVLQQYRRPDEILVCDDNSTDNTLEVCARYKDHLSICINPDGPSGFVNAWNRAIARTKGEYISILHQDDLLDPKFIQRGMAALERDPGVRHLFSTCRYIDDKGRTISLSYSPDRMDAGEVRLTGPEYLRSYQRQGQPHIHRCPGVITHRSIFEQCSYEPSAGHIADDDFFYRVGMFTDVIGILTPLAAFRVHDWSVTGSMCDSRLVSQLADDYLYQCRQWKGHPFLDEVSYGYFVKNAHLFIRRLIGYGLRQKKIGMVLQGIRKWSALKRLT